MSDDDLRFLTAPIVADSRRLAAARTAAARLARHGEDPEPIERSINDAYLRLQFALVTGMGSRAHAECIRLRALAGAAQPTLQTAA